ncbi:MAG: rod-binding protein [Lachnospiraceae bacterium]|nr:rod-binding protein [Lachnospiraceae bacterium]
MDISNLNSSYTDLYSAAAQSSKLENTLRGNYETAQDEDLMEACKKFESYFLEQVFKEMQKTVPKSSEGAQNAMTEYFEDRLVQQIAEDSTQRSSLGLAQTLYEQMKRNYGTNMPETTKSEE